MKQNWHALSVEEIIRELKSDAYLGLSGEEAGKRQQKFGFNKLPGEKLLSRPKIFLEQFKSPLIYILVIAGILTLLLKEYANAVVIFGAVFLNTVFGFFQENKTSRVLAELKKLAKVRTYVVRSEDHTSEL